MKDLPRDEICPSCGINLAVLEHTCPYGEEMCNDFDAVCVCCEECENQCAMET